MGRCAARAQVAGPLSPGGDAGGGTGQRHPKQAREVCPHTTGPVAPQKGRRCAAGFALCGLRHLARVVRQSLPTFEWVAPTGFNLEPPEVRGGEKERDFRGDSCGECRIGLDASAVGGVSALGGVLVSVSLNSRSRRSVGMRSRGRARRRGPLRVAEPPALRQRRLRSAPKPGESGSRASGLAPSSCSPAACAVGGAPLAAPHSSRHHPMRTFRASSSGPVDQSQCVRWASDERSSLTCRSRSALPCGAERSIRVGQDRTGEIESAGARRSLRRRFLLRHGVEPVVRGPTRQSIAMNTPRDCTLNVGRLRTAPVAPGRGPFTGNRSGPKSTIAPR
jgi:hypothetical protein